MEAYQHLQRLAALPQEIVKSASDHMVVTDINGNIWYVAPALARLAGSSAARMIGTPVTRLLPDVQIRSYTPGYNLAWVAFSFPTASARQFLFEPHEREPLLANVQIATVYMGLTHWFVLHVNPVEAED
ncbi:MAG: PAS domain S-box protein [Rhodocyclaceae bacterium]|nr:PAS domain S-box protein [Rhodocyclaceae bacterium]